MAASNLDKLMEVGIATATTLDANYTINDTSITVASTSGWPTATGVAFAIDVVDSAGVQVPGTYNEYVGVVSSATSITSVDHMNGTDRNYSAGATTRAYIPVSAERENRIVEWGLVHADQDGTLKAGAVDNAAVLASNVVTTAKILDSNVTTAKIADSNVTSAKLAQTFFKGRYQSSTTDSDQSGITVQFGWGFVPGNSASVATKAVTFPTAYTTPLAVIISSAGYRSGSDPTDITQLDDGEGGEIVHRQTYDVVTTGFTAKIIAENGRTLTGSTIRYGFTWIAFGIV